MDRKRPGENIESSKSESLISGRTVTIFIAVLLILTVPAAGIYLWESKRMEVSARQAIDDMMAPYQHNLISQMEQQQGHLHGLVAFTEANRGSDKLDRDFDTFARGLMVDEPGIRAVEIAPGGVIQFVYPVAGNEAVMGADLAKDKRPAVRRDVKKGIETGLTILGGPYKLLQGGQGFVAREPIFNQDKSFWAMAQIVFNVDNLISGADLKNKDLPFRVALRMEDEVMIYGDAKILRQSPVVKKFKIMNRTVEMAGVPPNGWAGEVNAGLARTLFADIFLTILFAALITGGLDRQRYLNAKVAVQTEELAGVNENLTRVNRLYSMITAINEAIIRSTDETTLYDDVCRIAVEKGGFRMSWIGLVDEADMSVNPVAMSGFVDNYLDEVQISVKDIPSGQGPTGTAIRENRTYTCSNIEIDPIMAPWRERALKRGYHASGAFPIRVKDEATGALMVYDSNPGVFKDEEVALLEEITADISYALAKITQERDLEHAASFPRANPSPIVEFHVSGLVLYHNEAAAKALDRAGLAGQFDLFKPKDMDILIRLFVDNPGITMQYREASIGDKVFGETIVFFKETETIRIYTLDVTDKKTFETELLRRQEDLEDANILLSRTLTMYEVLSQASEAILKSSDKRHLLETTCRIMTEKGGYDLAFTITYDQNKKKMKTIAASNKGPQFAAFIKEFTSKAMDNENISKSIASHEPFICLDLKNCSCSEDWKDDLLKPGFAVYGVFPIENFGEEGAAIAAFSSDPGL